MGQAKQRGTFEQRKSEGEARLHQEAIARKQAEIERKNARSSAQVKKEKRANIVVGSMLGLAMGALSSRVAVQNILEIKSK